jgi:hypothetical protein
MKEITEKISIIEVTPENVSEAGVFCVKDKKSPGHKAKVEWVNTEINNGLKILIALDQSGKQLGFIEYIPSENAWRPVKAHNFLFIQCIFVYPNEERNKELGSHFIQLCENDARKLNKSGVCAISSEGVWIANKSLFEKNGFVVGGKSGRFELMIKSFYPETPKPEFIDFEKQLNQFPGWNLVYSDQCPWHIKSVADLKESALQNGIDLKIKKLSSPSEAQNAPSGFGTFSLVRDGKLLEDHYISRKRFENIMRKEIKS